MLKYKIPQIVTLIPRTDIPPMQVQGCGIDASCPLVWRGGKIRVSCFRKSGTFRTDALPGNNQLLWQTFNKRCFRIVQCKNKGVPHTIQRSKGQSFLPVQTGENLCISYESLRFLRWPLLWRKWDIQQKKVRRNDEPFCSSSWTWTKDPLINSQML